MRRRLSAGLLAINGLIAIALVATPAQTQVIPLRIFDCCQPLPFQSLSYYCCPGCCWHVNDCEEHEDCYPTLPG